MLDFFVPTDLNHQLSQRLLINNLQTFKEIGYIIILIYHFD